MASSGTTEQADDDGLVEDDADHGAVLDHLAADNSPELLNKVVERTVGWRKIRLSSQPFRRAPQVAGTCNAWLRSSRMKAALPIGLVVISMTVGHAAWAAPDWAQTCATVGHFAGLVAAERDQRVQADAAVSTARRILDEPWMITDEVGAEVAGQVYATSQRSPAEENAALRAECLTPVREPPEAASRRARIVVGVPIELNLGTNHIKQVTPDGRDADITLAWRDDGDGRGHDVFSLTVADAGPVMMPSGGDTIHDDPDHDRDMRVAVRFARGQVDGQDTTLLLTATRQPGSGPTPTLYRVFRLSRQDDTYRFVPVLSEQLARSCNADMALSVAARLPLRSSYRGAPTANGCPPPSQVARKE